MSGKSSVSTATTTVRWISTFGGGTGRVVTNFGSTAGNFNNNKLADLGDPKRREDRRLPGQADPPNTGDVLALARYTTAGILDSTFGSGGIRTPSEAVMDGWKRALTIDPVSGKIIVTGTGPEAHSFERSVSPDSPQPAIWIQRSPVAMATASTMWGSPGHQVSSQRWTIAGITVLHATVGLSSPTVQVLEVRHQWNAGYLIRHRWLDDHSARRILCNQRELNPGSQRQYRCRRFHR